MKIIKTIYVIIVLTFGIKKGCVPIKVHVINYHPPSRRYKAWYYHGNILFRKGFVNKVWTWDKNKHAIHILGFRFTTGGYYAHKPKTELF